MHRSGNKEWGCMIDMEQFFPTDFLFNPPPSPPPPPQQMPILWITVGKWSTQYPPTASSPHRQQGQATPHPPTRWHHPQWGLNQSATCPPPPAPQPYTPTPPFPQTTASPSEVQPELPSYDYVMSQSSDQDKLVTWWGVQRRGRSVISLHHGRTFKHFPSLKACKK